MNKATELILEMEEKAGQRVDENGFDNLAMAGLFGAIGRAMGINKHLPKDDVAAGVVLRHQASPEFEHVKKMDEMLASAISAGIPPDFFTKK